MRLCVTTTGTGRAGPSTGEAISGEAGAVLPATTLLAIVIPIPAASKKMPPPEPAAALAVTVQFSTRSVAPGAQERTDSAAPRKAEFPDSVLLRNTTAQGVGCPLPVKLSS